MSFVTVTNRYSPLFRWPFNPIVRQNWTKSQFSVIPKTKAPHKRTMNSNTLLFVINILLSASVKVRRLVWGQKKIAYWRQTCHLFSTMDKAGCHWTHNCRENNGHRGQRATGQIGFQYDRTFFWTIGVLKNWCVGTMAWHLTRTKSVNKLNNKKGLLKRRRILESHGHNYLEKRQTQ